MHGRPDEPLEEGLGRILHQAPEHRARPEFRSRLKDGFTSGRLAEGGDADGRGVARGRRPLRRSPWWLVVGAVAAAVLAWFGFGLLSGGADPASPTPGWNLTDGRGFVLVGDRRLELARDEGRAELGELLISGGEWVNGDELLRFAIDDTAYVEVEPGTRLSVMRASVPPSRPARILLSGDHGGVRVATGRAYRPGDFFVRTPHTEVHPVGTLFGVDLYAELTCVCCMQGLVRLDRGAPEDVDAGQACLVYADRNEPLADIPDHHRSPLETFRDHVRKCWPACKD